MAKNEILFFILASIIASFVVAFSKFSLESWLVSSLMVAIIFLVNLAASKVAAYYLGCETEIKLWTFRRYWLRWQDKFKFDFPIWIVLPLFLAVITNGFLKWTAILTFDAKPIKVKVKKRFSEIKEYDLALIASAGILANLIIALIAKICTLNEFALLSCWFAFLSMLPLGNMAGTKIFFGSKMLWIFLVVLTLITLILIGITNAFATVFIALILAAIAAIIFYYFSER